MTRLRLSPFIRLLLVLLVAAAAAAACPRPAAATADPAGRIDRILQQQDLLGSASLVVWDLETARLLYDLNPNELLMPASNLKLVTSATALWAWGAGHRIETRLFVPGQPTAAGVLHGDVCIKGYGDPSFSTLAYQRKELHIHTAAVEIFVRRLKQAGVRKIKGSVIADESWFDRQRASSTWQASLLDECGRLSATAANEGLSGTGERVGDSALYAAQLLTEALRTAHIKVTGEPRLGRVATGAELLAKQRSAPLATLLKRLSKDSDNFFAETLTKGLGRDLAGEGSTDAGLQATRATLAAVGIEAWEYRLADGSGLSYDNRLTVAGIARLLVAAYQRPDYGTFSRSLAVAGKDGTLRRRMRGTAAAYNARAKTGTLDHASALSGYVTSADGHTLAFAILVNDDPLSIEAAEEAEDEIVAALAASAPGGESCPRCSPQQRQHAPGAAAAQFTIGRALVPCADVGP